MHHTCRAECERVGKYWGKLLGAEEISEGKGATVIPSMVS
jgi:hypothetical protein